LKHELPALVTSQKQLLTSELPEEERQGASNLKRLRYDDGVVEKYKKAYQLVLKKNRQYRSAQPNF